MVLNDIKKLCKAIIVIWPFFFKTKIVPRKVCDKKTIYLKKQTIISKIMVVDHPYRPTIPTVQML